MHETPDYATLRRETPFSRNVTATYLAYLHLSGVPIRDFYLDPEACIEVYRTGRRRARDLFGDDISYAGPATPPISYGHPNTLGCELLFPDGGEVGVEHAFADSLERGIAALRERVDFSRAGMAAFYERFRDELIRAFPTERVGFSFGLEGPITTAYVLRGDAFFTDLIDEPARVREFLALLTDSIIQFHQYRCSVTGADPRSAAGAGMCDDVASMVPPRMWDEMVLPYWEQYYDGMTTGRRSAHVEDLRPEQLQFLERVGLWFYDPSISAKLDPSVIVERCRVPFLWRLGSFHYPGMSVDDVRAFVISAAADGASQVTTYPEAIMCRPENVPKVKAFIESAKQVEALLADGCSRKALRQELVG